MNIREICRRGYFDKVTLNISVEPVVDGDTEIFGDMSFKECILDELNSVDNTISKVRINILGVDCIKRNCITPDELNKESKRGASIFKIERNDIKSYIIAYCDIIVVKDSSNTNVIKDSRGYNYDMDMLIEKAIQIQKKTSDKNNIAIVDKLFVNEQYRRCGISSWIHLNLRDILQTYIEVQIGDMMLIPGDFTNEADRMKIPEKKYVDMLKSHYNDLGYRMTKLGFMINKKARADKQSTSKIGSFFKSIIASKN